MKETKPHYAGVITADGVSHLMANGHEVSPERSLRVRALSPDGLGWGCFGPKSAQLALAILLDVTGSERRAVAMYQDLKNDCIANWEPTANWIMWTAHIWHWIHQWEKTHPWAAEQAASSVLEAIDLAEAERLSRSPEGTEGRGGHVAS